uniref:Maternal effect embryo arrest 60 n=1 Tax=Kalanchoe fedtschenkoi TaxID=63787 RepID=A0A7N0TH87_KALFE
METASPRRQSGSGTSIHVTALDAIINVNSLFTLAVFLGLAWNPSDPSNSLVSDQSCVASASYAEDVVSFHVYSFSSFLFSSLIALALKQAVRIVRNPGFPYAELLAHVNKSALRVGMLISGVGSVCGCAFLMMALVNVVQVKLGTLACGSSHSFAAVVPLVILVPSALLVYVSVVLYAFTR